MAGGYDDITLRLPKGSLARIKLVLHKNESQARFLRLAVSSLLVRREKLQRKKDLNQPSAVP